MLTLLATLMELIYLKPAKKNHYTKKESEKITKEKAEKGMETSHMGYIKASKKIYRSKNHILYT